MGLNRPSRALTWANELAMPFQMWHQTVIVVVAYFVVQWSAEIAVKFAVISTVSPVVTLVLCLMVERLRLTRLPFGIRRST